MASRYYSSVAAVTTLSNGVSPSGTSFIVGSTSGFPVQTPFTLLIDEGTQSEEIVSVVNMAGTTLTVTRGEDGTVAVAHDPGARVRHAMTARDLRESREHESATTGVHGITSTANLATKTGVETLTNKTLASPSITGTVPGTTAFSAISVAGASAGSTPFGAWQSYTPSWRGTSNPAIGNGTLSGRYIQIGKTVHFILQVVAGSTTTLGSGAWQFGLPVPAFGGAYWASGSGFVNTPNRPLIWRAISTSEVFAYEASTNTALSSSTAFPSGAVLLLSGTYEAA